MNMRSISDSEKRTISMAAVTIVFALSWVLGVKPYRAALAAARESLSTERAGLDKERAAVAGSKRDPLLIHAVDSAMDAFGTRLFVARDEAVGAADLQSYVTGLARGNHVLVQQSNTEKTIVSRSGVRTLRAKIRAESDLRGILGLLEALEHGDHLVTIENLDIQRPANDEQTSDIEVLSLSLTVRGYMVGDPPPPPGARGAAPKPGATGATPARGAR